jgi:hypothetical protein
VGVHSLRAAHPAKKTLRGAGVTVAPAVLWCTCTRYISRGRSLLGGSGSLEGRLLSSACELVRRRFGRCRKRVHTDSIGTLLWSLSSLVMLLTFRRTAVLEGLPGSGLLDPPDVGTTVCAKPMGFLAPIDRVVEPHWKPRIQQTKGNRFQCPHPLPQSQPRPCRLVFRAQCL